MKSHKHILINSLILFLLSLSLFCSTSLTISNEFNNEYTCRLSHDNNYNNNKSSNGLILKCFGLNGSNYNYNDNGRNLWEPILDYEQFSEITTIIIQKSTFLPQLDLSIFSPFTSLSHLEISHSQVESFIGQLTGAPGLTSLNLSYNGNFSINFAELFINNASSSLLLLDLSHNSLSQLDLDIFTSPGHQLKSLGLAGNNFSCAWVRNELYKWWSINQSVVLLNENSTVCSANEIAFDSLPFRIALELKARGVQECESTICSCDSRGYFINKLPNPSFPNVVTSPTLNATLSLKLDCSNMSLIELPNITRFATVLSVQYNSITSLDRISTDENYRNLIGIDLSYNQLASIQFLTESKFIDHFQFILLVGNQISQIPEHIITQIFAETRKRLMRIKLGHNEIDCDCFTHTKLRPLLIRNQKVIDDWRNISCKAPISKSLLDLKRTDVCSNDDDEDLKSNLDFVWYILIGVEGTLIIMIIAKVWYDSKQYRATGNLPSCSLCIPRLPCDFMLEGLKDTKHHHHGHGHQGHHHSSNDSNNTTGRHSSTHKVNNRVGGGGGRGSTSGSSMGSQQQREKLLVANV